ncbi:DUF6154 family protein [Bacillus testis]|uniref:DUF6154 family protein n=1 Tax=Bacillus testis TaxID=1622072 RepID=UPI00067F5077|nr:DUF6154 family protein [Bacillus testis]
MKLVEDLFEHYRTKLTGDDEDIDILTLAVLEQLDHKEILDHILDMDEVELRSFFGLYIMETLKGKFAGVESVPAKNKSFNHSYRYLH